VAAVIPGAQRVGIPNAGHFSMEDAPGEVAAALADFLAP
jgi:pimeloyl-ACP methyl ester carboxylesterase